MGKVGCHQNLVTELQRQKCIFLPTTLTQPAATISVVSSEGHFKNKDKANLLNRGSCMQPYCSTVQTALYVHAEGKCDVP